MSNNVMVMSTVLIKKQNQPETNFPINNLNYHVFFLLN